MHTIDTLLNANSSRSLTILFLLTLAAPAVGCEQESAKSNVNEATTTPTSAGNLQAILGHYEAIRHKLLSDETTGIKEAAEKIAGLAAEGENPASAPIGRAATQLAGKAGDLAAARLAFGELSQRFIEALDEDAPLKQKLHLFKCPMAKGYGQWVQIDAKLGNPYMGQSMPGCGSHMNW